MLVQSHQWTYRSRWVWPNRMKPILEEEYGLWESYNMCQTATLLKEIIMIRKSDYNWMDNTDLPTKITPFYLVWTWSWIKSFVLIKLGHRIQTSTLESLYKFGRRWEVFCTIHYFKKICVKHLQLGQDFETFHQIKVFGSCPLPPF